jgi:hypothetical protein
LKNKILVVFIVLIVSGTNIYAKEKDTGKLIAGILLTAAGGVVAYNGFQMDEISFPEMTMASFSTLTTNTGPGQWSITTNGTLKNTGNVDLKNVSVTVIYKDYTGAEIADSTVTYSNTFAPGNTSDLSTSSSNLPDEPLFFSVKYQADFKRLYENNSVSTGIAGAVMAAGGIFLICDYFFDFSDYFEQNGMKVSLAAMNNGLSFMTSKTF